ncbi:uncharacterized protein [Amphiura filiformis]|uniref:uncharacterized protein n=1 Tax=Amphiura filiformis TaxID=82378 RepID=UPI003B221D09
MVYWADYILGSISRSYLNGSHQQEIVTGLQGPAGLVLDPLSPHLYFTDEGSYSIGVVNRNGTNQSMILENLDYRPRPIVLDSNSGYIYWAEWDSSKTNSQSKIQRSLLNGSHVTPIIQSDLMFPNGLAIDVQGGFLYWCDARTHKIEKSSLNGQNRKVLFIGTSNIDPFGVALYQNDLYWSDWSVDHLTRLHINNSDVTSGTSIVPTAFHMASGIHIQEDILLCLFEPCLHGATCVDDSSGFTCICPPGYCGKTCELVDDTPPVPSCPNNITRIIDINSSGKNITFQPATATDNSGMTFLVNQTHRTGQVFPTGTTRVTYTFRDPSDNTASCSFNIIIEVDDTPPVPSCPSDITRAIDINTNGTKIAFQDATATDNSGIAFLVNQTHRTGQFFPTGTTKVTYTFKDPSDNTASCSFNITIIEVDDTPPVPSCPNNIKRIIDINTGGTTIAFHDAAATDNSGMAILINQTHRTGQFFPTGTTKVTYTFKDPSDNKASCSFNITIIEVDDTPPEPRCPNDITHAIDINTNGAKIAFQNATATDNSGIAILVNQTHRTGQFFPTGTTKVTYTFRDPSDNKASCSFNITVIEVTLATKPGALVTPDKLPYQASDLNNTKQLHTVVTTAVWAVLLVSVLMIIMAVIYYKIPCSKKFKVLYETNLFKSEDTSHLVTYQSVSEQKPPKDDYATSIKKPNTDDYSTYIKMTGTMEKFHHQDNPGYMGQDGIIGLQPPYINMLPSDGDCTDRIFLVQQPCQPPQPPQPPSINKLNTLVKLQNL